MFIGRHRELALLNNAWQSGKPELVIVSGRRRIGKTSLLTEFCRGKNALFYSALQTNDTSQRCRFTAALKTAGVPSTRFTECYEDWDTALSETAYLPGAGKKLVVIDELPYMAEQNGALASILQHVWDHALSKGNVMLVLCGSSVSFMDGLLGAESPLFGRHTALLNLGPLAFHDACAFFPNYSLTDKTAAWAILGGSPQCLTAFDPAKSLKDNIIDAVLTPGFTLRDAPMTLLRQECREPARYNDIMRAVALGSANLSEIASKSDIAPPNALKFLETLAELGFIRREINAGTTKKGTAKVRGGLWVPADNFAKFWFEYIWPNQAQLELGGAETFWTETIAPDLNRIVSGPFEELCRQFIRVLSVCGQLPFKAQSVRRWENPAGEVDIVAEGAPGKAVLFGECKYRNAPMGLGDFLRLKAKAEKYPAGKRFYALFSKEGFESPVIELAANPEEHLQLFPLAELCAPWPEVR